MGPHFRTAGAFALVALLALPAAAAGDGVVARVNGVEILAADVERARSQVPPEYRQIPPATLDRLILDSMIDSVLAAQAARKDGLHEGEVYKRQMARIGDQLLERLYLADAIDKRITAEALKAGYERFLKELDNTEVRASHIVVATEAEAKNVIREIEGGANFADIAKKRSKDGAAAAGGDLGYFRREGMIAEFSDAAFAMKPGDVSKVPLRTQHGWHVIKVADRRAGQPPSFAEVEDDLRDQLAGEIGATIRKELREAAEIAVEPSGR